MLYVYVNDGCNCPVVLCPGMEGPWWRTGGCPRGPSPSLWWAPLSTSSVWLPLQHVLRLTPFFISKQLLWSDPADPEIYCRSHLTSGIIIALVINESHLYDGYLFLWWDLVTCLNSVDDGRSGWSILCSTINVAHSFTKESLCSPGRSDF